MIFKSKRRALEDDEIRLFLLYTSKVDEPGGKVTSKVYDIIRKEDEKVVGRCDIRFGPVSELYYLGNIGYAIYPPYRGHRYAAKATELMFEVAKRSKVKELIITCNPDNIPSRRTCEILGCELKAIVDVPLNHPLIEQGDYQKCIYIKKLEEL